MQNMIMFRLNRECREIAVNPSRVLYVSHYETGASSVHFGKDCFVRVQGEMDEVVAKIEAALCGRPSQVSEASREIERPGVN